MATPRNSLPGNLIWPRTDTISWRVRLALLVLLVVAIATVWTTNGLLTDRIHSHF